MTMSTVDIRRSLTDKPISGIKRKDRGTDDASRRRRKRRARQIQVDFQTINAALKTGGRGRRDASARVEIKKRKQAKIGKEGPKDGIFIIRGSLSDAGKPETGELRGDAASRSRPRKGRGGGRNLGKKKKRADPITWRMQIKEDALRGNENQKEKQTVSFFLYLHDPN